VWALVVRGVIMNERDYVTCCAPVGLTFLVLDLGECEINFSCKFIFPRNMLDYRMLRRSVMWEPQLPLNSD